MRKKIKFLSVCISCLIVLALSSCVKSSDDLTNIPAFVMVYYNSGSPTFVDSNGDTYIPTSSTYISNGKSYSVTSENDGHLAYIIYSCNKVSITSSNVITLSYFKDLETTFHNTVIYTTMGAANDSINKFKLANDSLASIDGVVMAGNPAVSSMNTHLLAY